ncbi:MAG: alpha-2-macroglobulin family protein [Rubrivivax sp.]
MAQAPRGIWRVAAAAAVLAASVTATSGAAFAAAASPAATRVADASGSAGQARASLSLQGEVGQAQQLQVRYDRAVVPLGQADAAAPVRIDCADASASGSPPGQGRWADERTWVFDFADVLAPGLECSVHAVAGDLPGQPPLGRFSAGGPAVVQALPWPGSEIEEDQHFLLRLTGPAVARDVLDRAHCRIEGLGDRIPVQLRTGPEREQLLRRNGLWGQADRVLVLACGRPLPAAVAMQLVFGPGIGAQRAPAVRSTTAQTFDYRVRPAFTADVSCERERAQAPCLPIRPLRVQLSSAIPRAQAEAVRLSGPISDTGDGARAQPIPARAPRALPEDDAEVSQLVFDPPFAESARYRIELSAPLRDVTGRPLANARSFPLEIRTGEAPPIAKFAAAPFGILEWGPEAALPVTLRHVQHELRNAGQPQPGRGEVRVRRIDDEAQVLAWMQRLQRHHEARLPARELGLPEAQWYDWHETQDLRGRPVKRRTDRLVHTREVSLLADDTLARRLTLPQLTGGDPRPFEVVGIGLTEPGYHVVEIESQRLGAALLARPAPMYVRTGVLVTNLGVHFKHGRQSSAVWVTTLDRGQPVAGADVTVHDCLARVLWRGRSDAAGLARIDQPLTLGTQRCPAEDSLFVTARHAGQDGRRQLGIVFSHWNQGIEPWRFSLPSAPPEWAPAEPDLRVHTVFDRTLLRAGETVSMKHYARLQLADGLGLAEPGRLPSQMRIVHVGSGDEFVQPIGWDGGGRSALAQWTIPKAARLGEYQVALERPVPKAGAGGTASTALAPPRDDDTAPRTWDAGTFRVEAFEVPLVDARLSGPSISLIRPREVAFDALLRYANGGAVADAAVQLSALLRPATVNFPDHEGYRFDPPEGDPPAPEDADDADEPTRPSQDATGVLIADRLAGRTDRRGATRLRVPVLPGIDRPSEIRAELTYVDPNGQSQTVSTSTRVWPSAVVPGIKADAWIGSRERTGFTALALDRAGRPMPGQVLEVHARLRQTLSTRKRLVGGFYAWEHRTRWDDLGRVCGGRTDRRGRLACEVAPGRTGEVELVVSARDKSGHLARAATRVWITGADDLWFETSDDDRIEVLPLTRRVEPGQTARLQVRMPFRQATALVTVEREGVLDARVVPLQGKDPVIEVPIGPGAAPNAYVSVLVVRGRVRPATWDSLLAGDWRTPVDWARRAWGGADAAPPPTAMADLARPTFRLGVAALEVGTARHELQVRVEPLQAVHQVRQTARVRVTVTHAGKPVPGAEIAFAAVDEGLLALQPNTSWDLLQAMMQPRPWSVATSTAQGEVIGRRHYGRKAVAAGGGGGLGHTRELFDTLLLWAPRVPLDARGQALIDVPLNDALTSFRLVAVADALTPVEGAGHGAGNPQVHRFGTGTARIRTTQDLQLLSALPTQAREHDRLDARLTVRNTTSRAMQVQITLQGRAHGADGIARPLDGLPPRRVTIEPGSAAEVAWEVTVPARVERIVWDASAEEAGAQAGGRRPPDVRARDRLRLTQSISPVVPERTLQATLRPLGVAERVPIETPSGALRDAGVPRGGLWVDLLPSLSGTLPGLRQWFEAYPYTCLEQQASRAIGLGDANRWALVANELPTYLDEDGLATYFPSTEDQPARGDARLTAYLIASAHAAGFEWPVPLRDRMLDGLEAFVEGRVTRRVWSPVPDLDVRRMAAIEALSRHGRARAGMIDTLRVQPARWPSAALIDWVQILRRVPEIPDRQRRLEEATRLLRARVVGTAGTLRLQASEGDVWWWLMDSADTNGARLLLAAMDDPAWLDDVPRLLLGHLAAQRRGAWDTTTANAWTAIALARHAARFEAVPVGGRTTATTVDAPGTRNMSDAGAEVARDRTPTPSPARLDWSATPQGGRLTLPWPVDAGTLEVRHEGPGRPWLLLQTRAAVPTTQPVRAGYALTRELIPVQQRVPPHWSRGDLVRVRLTVQASQTRNWVAVTDPLPPGATVLGGGLARDSEIAMRGQRDEGSAWVAFDERSATAFRRYFELLPRGRHVVEYTLRLNQSGDFGLPPTRAEAMYLPDVHGEWPNGVWTVRP